MHKVLVTILTLTLLSIGRIQAQDAIDSTGFAAIDAEGNLIVSDADGSVNIISTPDFRNFASLAWSDDGSKLAYIGYNQEFQAEPWVTDLGSGDAFKLETGLLEAGFPAIFTPEGQILYVQQGDFAVTPYQAHMMNIAPEPDAQPVELGAFDYGVGCGGGSSYAADWQYWGEAGFGGDELALIWTKYGIVHNVSCASLGLALFDTSTGEDRPLPAVAFDLPEGASYGGLGRVALSHDGQKLAAVRMLYDQTSVQRSLVTIDLVRAEVTEFPTSVMPEHVVWGPAGTLLYSSREQVKDLMADLSAEGKTNAEKFLGEGTPVPAYQSSITQLDPATGEEHPVYDGYVYAIGRMIWADDKLIFSTVANMDEWVARMAEGSLDPADEQVVAELVPVSLYELALGGAESLIGHFSMVELQ